MYQSKNRQTSAIYIAVCVYIYSVEVYKKGRVRSCELSTSSFPLNFSLSSEHHVAAIILFMRVSRYLFCQIFKDESLKFPCAVLKKKYVAR